MYFDQLLDFSNITFIIPAHFIIVPYFTLRMLDFEDYQQRTKVTPSWQKYKTTF